jgi:hypothetical protein
MNGGRRVLSHAELEGRVAEVLLARKDLSPEIAAMALASLHRLGRRHDAKWCPECSKAAQGDRA